AGVAWQLGQKRIDVAILFPNTFRSALVAWLGGCRRRVGFARYWRNALLTHALPPRRDQRGRLFPCPIIEDYNRLVEHVGCPSLGFRMELATTVRAEREADAVWEQAGLSCFH